MGYYYQDTYWPFPISKALRSMEDDLFQSLKLSAGNQVLDAGCGIGHVAMHFAQRGIQVEGVDIVDRHGVPLEKTMEGR